MKRQRWFKAYLRHVIFNDGARIRERLEYLFGFKGEDTVASAFQWALSIEGYSFWNRCNNDFINWYYYGAQ